MTLRLNQFPWKIAKSVGTKWFFVFLNFKFYIYSVCFCLLILDRAPSEERVRDPSIYPGSLSTDGEGKKQQQLNLHDWKFDTSYQIKMLMI